MNPNHWRMRDRLLSLHTQWFTLLGEQLEDNRGQLLEYWRVERADSVIIIPILRQQLIIPMSTYRPGVGQATLDFPGGRCLVNQTPIQAATKILQRELGITAGAIAHLAPLNQTGWAINSSFSNQKLFGFVAQLRHDTEISSMRVEATYAADPQGIHQLLEILNCLQCRLVLREWHATQMGNKA